MTIPERKNRNKMKFILQRTILYMLFRQGRAFQNPDIFQFAYFFKTLSVVFDIPERIGLSQVDFQNFIFLAEFFYFVFVTVTGVSFRRIGIKLVDGNDRERENG